MKSLQNSTNSAVFSMNGDKSNSPIKINTAFQAHFNEYREREELARLKARRAARCKGGNNNNTNKNNHHQDDNNDDEYDDEDSDENSEMEFNVHANLAGNGRNASDNEGSDEDGGGAPSDFMARSDAVLRALETKDAATLLAESETHEWFPADMLRQMRTRNISQSNNSKTEKCNSKKQMFVKDLAREVLLRGGEEEITAASDAGERKTNEEHDEEGHLKTPGAVVKGGVFDLSDDTTVKEDGDILIPVQHSVYTRDLAINRSETRADHDGDDVSDEEAEKRAKQKQIEENLALLSRYAADNMEETSEGEAEHLTDESEGKKTKNKKNKRGDKEELCSARSARNVADSIRTALQHHQKMTQAENEGENGDAKREDEEKSAKSRSEKRKRRKEKKVKEALEARRRISVEQEEQTEMTQQHAGVTSQQSDSTNKINKRGVDSQIRTLELSQTQRKLEALKRICGGGGGFGEMDVEQFEADLDADYDAERHSAMMRQQFGDEFYHQNNEDGLEKETEEKIARDFEEFEDEFGREEMHCVETDSDEEQNEETQNEAQKTRSQSNSSKLKSKRAANSQSGFFINFPEEDSKSSSSAATTTGGKARRGGGSFGPNHRLRPLVKKRYDPAVWPNFEDYLDEVYGAGLGEDEITDSVTQSQTGGAGGGHTKLRCAFPYRSVSACSFGMSTREILETPGRILNAWVGVKRMSQYVSEEKEAHDALKFRSERYQQKKRALISPPQLEMQREEPREQQKEEEEEIKENEEENETKEEEELPGERCKKKRRRRNRKNASSKRAEVECEEMMQIEEPPEREQEGETSEEQTTKAEKKSGKKRRKEWVDPNKPVLSENRMASLGIHPKKYKHIKLVPQTQSQ